MKNFLKSVLVIFGLWIAIDSKAQKTELDNKYTPGTNSPYHSESRGKRNSMGNEVNNSISLEVLALTRGGFLITYERNIKNGFSAFASVGPKPLKDFVGDIFNTGSSDIMIGEEKIGNNELSSYYIYETPFTFSKSSPIFQFGIRILDDDFLKGKGLEIMYRTFNETFFLTKQNIGSSFDNSSEDFFTTQDYSANVRSSMFYLGFRKQDFSNSIAWGLSCGVGLRINNMPQIDIEKKEISSSGFLESSKLSINNSARETTVVPTLLLTFNLGFGM